MKAAIQAVAAQLGFDRCRVTPADPPASAPHFQHWLARGWHGEMAYLARNAERRVDPQHVLPGAHSVIVVAVSYAHDLQTPFAPPPPSPEGRPDADPPRQGRVARYARLPDYHDGMGEKLAALAEAVDHRGGPGTRSRWYVDTGPVLERDLAARAGLGFVGKHTNLIVSGIGNWSLLGCVLTTARLEPDPPEPPRCGRCVRCLEACPTQAIRAPFQLDARRCISYLTIELKGPIPEELRPAVGDRVFGCDDCLEVCPWNRFAAESQTLRARLRPDLRRPDLKAWLGLDQAGFQRTFAGTPLLRAKRRGLLRNVCVALGNVGGTDALPALERAAQDPEPLIAEHARWAIARITRRQADEGKPQAASE